MHPTRFRHSLKIGIQQFVTGRVGIYKSFFIYLIIPQIILSVSILGLSFLWLKFVQDFEPSVLKHVLGIFIEAAIVAWNLVLVITTFSTCWSSGRTISSKRIKLIHKINAVLIILFLIFFWVLYVISLYFPTVF